MKGNLKSLSLFLNKSQMRRTLLFQRHSPLTPNVLVKGCVPINF
ncbi:unnamed protein product [Arabidopsis thaliana]|uniref:(thale cress) hypothetical protein n=1 Tax=Arabidopsis thaliana TaxID=3702 RepID=A0A7G2ER37_ARATH|nr:unnamed protein product [Arabidopsis thaliana]